MDVGRRVERRAESFGGGPDGRFRELGAALDPPSDVHASAGYRRHLAEISAVRAVLQAAERARG